VRHDGELGAEALDVLGLAAHVGLRDEQREVRVLRAARLDRMSISAWIRSQIAYPYGRITIVPRTGPLSASSAFAMTS